MASDWDSLIDNLPRPLSSLKTPCSALAACCLLGCGDRLELGSYVLWYADHETGDLSQWEAARESDGDVTLAAEVSTDHAHSGSYALKLSGAAPPLEFGAAFDFNRVPHAYFSAWFLMPEPVTTDGWPLFEFASRGEGCSGPAATCVGVEVLVRRLPNDEMLLYVFNDEAEVLQPPLPDPPRTIPLGSWFHLEVRYRRATDTSGSFDLWFDGTPLYHYEGWRTAELDNLIWGIVNPPSNEGESPVLYVDDTAISTIAVTPNGSPY